MAHLDTPSIRTFELNRSAFEVFILAAFLVGIIGAIFLKITSRSLLDASVTVVTSEFIVMTGAVGYRCVRVGFVTEDLWFAIINYGLRNQASKTMFVWRD